LEGMVKTGFVEVFCGIESPDREVLAGMKKGQNLAGDLGEKIKILQKHGLSVTAGFIIGNDEDKPSIFDKIFNFIQTNGIIIPMAGFLTVIRGTALHRRLESQKRLRPESCESNTLRLKLNFDPKMDEGVLVKGYVNLLKRLFSSRNYYARCRVSRKRQGPCREASRLNRSGITAVMRILHYNLVKHPDLEFVKFLFETLFTAPSKLPEILAEAAKLAGFQEITRATAKAYAYSEQISALAVRFQKRVAKLRGDTKKRARKIKKIKDRAVKKAVSLYQSLDPSLRAGAKTALECWHHNLNKYAKTTIADNNTIKQYSN